jgi:4-hydroxybenzoate polyprenyltransferase/phosphoserine phosphatase
MRKKFIVVDLDGTLVRTDMLIESLFLFIRLYPLRVFELIFWLLRGKAYFKRCLATYVIPEVDLLPYNEELLLWLKQERANGISLALATASDQRIANKVAAHLGIFDEVLGTDIRNLSSRNKRDALIQIYGEREYEYVGNSIADLAVWKTASAFYVVNPEIGVLSLLSKIGNVKMVFENRPAYFDTLIKELRIHQWVKNLLIFVPLLASHRMLEMPLLLNGLVAFISFGFCASSVYILNDLLDITDDRRHPSKCNRPLASGSFPILHAFFLIPAMLISAFALSLWFLPLLFSGMLAAYYILTIIYSLWIKRIVILDVIFLSILYTLRVVAGAAAMTLVATFWILTFCMFIFLSLAFVKRYAELFYASQKGDLEKTSERGYYLADFELLASLGGASGYISVLVLALYINDVGVEHLYPNKQWMWIACPLLMFWLGRIWLIAHRGQMHNDPIVFALRDNVSRWLGLFFVLVFVLASF